MKGIRQLLTLVFLTTVATSGFSQAEPNKVAARSITKELKLPTRKEAGKKQLAGIYTFVVELDGSLSTVNVKDSAGFGVDAQIVQKLSEAKGWKVPEVAGEPTRIAYQLPIRINLPKK